MSETVDCFFVCCYVRFFSTGVSHRELEHCLRGGVVFVWCQLSSGVVCFVLVVRGMELDSNR